MELVAPPIVIAKLSLRLHWCRESQPPTQCFRETQPCPPCHWNLLHEIMKLYPLLLKNPSPAATGYT
ncbi:hypothetical protein TIFTF001_000571 [Ficus carica]|uniref:Uncharacterized protein n=1 Tax=Ficus carica TaxID=3494 RepID=A0AA87YW79_FICCA|nr:hypothetical protein TIFTF001_000571 [Ficus carica]